MRVLFTDFGTAGDFRIAKTLLDVLRSRGHEISYVTPSNNSLTHAEDKIYHYPGSTPDEILSMIFKPGFIKTNRVFRAAADALLEGIRQDRPDVIIVIHSILPILAYIPMSLLERENVVTLFYGPMYPSCHVPYIYDTRLMKVQPGTAARFLAEVENPSQCKGNHNLFRDLTMLNHITNGVIPSLFRGDTFPEKIARTRVIAAWEPSMLKPPSYDLSPKESGEITLTGAILTPEEVEVPESFKPHQALRTFLNRVQRANKPWVVVTLGSFPAETQSISRLLTTFSRMTGTYVLVHDPAGTQFPTLATELPPSPSKLPPIMRIKGFVPYPWLLAKKPHALITSGSIIHQQIGLYYHVPLLYYPCLPEQYFWAMAYEKGAGVPYLRPVDLPSSIKPEAEFEDAVERILVPMMEKLTQPEAKRYIARVSTGLRPLDGTQRLAHALERIVRAKKRQEMGRSAPPKKEKRSNKTTKSRRRRSFGRVSRTPVPVRTVTSPAKSKK